MKRLFIIGIFLLVGCTKKDDREYTCSAANLPAFNAECQEIGGISEFRSDADRCAQKHAGTEGGITFAGSSTITGWDSLEADFPNFSVRNMGIGGSRLDHIIAFFEVLIFQNTPDITVLYIGDNDPFAYDFETFKRKMNAFVANYRHRLPTSDLVLLSIKPSPSRVDQRSFYLAVNDLYKSYSTTFDRVFFVDIWSEMDRGETSSFFADNLHLNRKGYEYVIAQLTPVLNAIAR